MNLPQLPENPLFSTFWKEYPHKVGKQAAIKAWNKLAPNEDDLETILKALRRQKQSKMWQEGIGIPHPSTYLNQARFMDEPIPEPEKKMVPIAKQENPITPKCEYPGCNRNSNTRTSAGWRCVTHM